MTFRHSPDNITISVNVLFNYEESCRQSHSIKSLIRYKQSEQMNLGESAGMEEEFYEYYQVNSD